jgi:hypothetical protein
VERSVICATFLMQLGGIDSTPELVGHTAVRVRGDWVCRLSEALRTIPHSEPPKLIAKATCRATVSRAEPPAEPVLLRSSNGVPPPRKLLKSLMPN